MLVYRVTWALFYLRELGSIIAYYVLSPFSLLVAQFSLLCRRFSSCCERLKYDSDDKRNEQYIKQNYLLLLAIFTCSENK